MGPVNVHQALALARWARSSAISRSYFSRVSNTPMMKLQGDLLAYRREHHQPASHSSTSPRRHRGHQPNRGLGFLLIFMRLRLEPKKAGAPAASYPLMQPTLPNASMQRARPYTPWTAEWCRAGSLR